MKLFIPITLFCLLFAQTATGQITPGDTSTSEYYRQMMARYTKIKDSLSALYPFIPAVSSILIQHREIELNHFNSLVTGTRYWDDTGEAKDINGRQTYLYSTFQITYGTSRNNRFNAGLDINTMVARVDWTPGHSAFRVFNPGSLENSSFAHAVTTISPRIRWRPLKRSNLFTLQSSLGIPMPLSQETQALLGYNQFYLLAQLMYNQPISRYMFLYTQLSGQYVFKKKTANTMFYSPVSIYLSYLITDNIVAFASAAYIPIFFGDAFTLTRYTWQMNGGLQYRLSKRLLVNTYYARGIKGRNYPDYNTYFLGFRYVTSRKVTGKPDPNH